jgi:diguanylate cyclase (GGDEF)-like protein
LTALAVRDGKPIYVPDVRHDPHYLEGAKETCTEFVIPLASTQGQIIAVINMEDQKPDAFSEKTRRVITDFANRAALVFENAVLLDTARQQSRRTELLNEIAQSCLEESSVALSLQEIVRQVVELTAVDSCLVELWDETRSANAPAADWWDGKDTIELDPEGSYEQVVTRLVMQRQEPVVYSDLREEAPPGAFFSRYGSRSILGMPLSANGMWLGAILVGCSSATPFRQVTIDLLRQAAVQIALGVAKTRLVEETRRRFEESEKLRQATAALATQLDFERVIALIAEHLPRLLYFDTLAVFHVRQNVIRPMLAVNLPIAQRLDSALFPRDDPFFKDLARQNSPLVLDAAAAETRYRALGGRDPIRCWAALPLFSGEEVAGSIEVGRLQREPFTPNEMLLLQVFSNQVSAALQNATLHGIEQQLATTDHLTGLYNRRGFIDLAHHEMERCWRFHRPVCMLMIDIDHFKQVNDVHSHIAGDAVLVQLAGLMRSTLREVDIICRYGGEEFCVMLPESDPHGALHVAERLRQAVQANTFLYRETEIRITISLGMSAFAGLNQSLEELIERADKALMTSKQAGRNRVTQG